MRLSPRIRFSTVFSVLAIVAVLLGVFTLRNIYFGSRINSLLQQSQKVLVATERVLFFTKEFGLGSRAFALTKDSATLKNYFIARDSIGAAIDRLSHNTKQNPSQYARVDSLRMFVSKRVQFSESLLILTAQGKNDAALSRLATMQNSAYMDSILNKVELIQQTEFANINGYLAEFDSNQKSFVWLFHVLMTLLVGMIAFATITVFKKNKQRKLVEAELHDRNEMYSQTLLSLAEGVIATDRNGVITLINKAAARLLGIKEPEALGLQIAHAFRINHENSGLELTNPVMTAMSENKIMLMANHTVLTRKDGTRLIIEDSAAPIHNMKGQVVGGVLIFRDVTQRKQVDDSLRKSEKRFRVYFENSMAGVLLTKPDGSILAANPAAQLILGKSEKEICEDGRSGSVDINDPRLNEFISKRARVGRASGELTLIRKGGIKFPAYVNSAVFDMESGEKGTILIFDDISERKKAENQIRHMNSHLEKLVEQKTKEVFEKEERYRYALDNMMEGVQIIDFNWHYLYLNEEAVNQSNLSRDQLLGNSMLELYPGIENTEMFQVLKGSMKTRSTARIDNQFMYSDKSSRWYNLSVLPVPEGLFILSSDITARKVTEQKLKEYYTEMEQTNAELKKINSELDRFVYSVSHDLRAPLTSILGVLNIVLRDIETKKVVPDNLRIERIMMIKKSALRLDDFIVDILDYSRNARTDVVNEEVNFNDLVTSIEENFRPMLEYLSCELSFKIEQKVQFISDKRRIGIILNNLISNGIKYRNLNKPDSFVSVHINVSENETIIEVSDNGIGIETKDLDNIFGMFQRMSNQAAGSGIGLYIVKEVLEKLHGKIEVDSEFGKGSKFTARIPNIKHKPIE